MKHKRIIPFLLALSLFSGCQLALPEESTAQAEDRLVGMLMTTEPLKLPPIEVPLKTGWNGEITVDEDALQKERRLYATLVTETLTNDDGETAEHQEYIFEGIDAPAIYSTYMTDERGDYYSSTSTDGMADVHHGVGSYDDREELTLSGTVYVWPGTGDHTVHFNPIYQQPDGPVYVTDGSSFGFAVGEGNRSEGEVFSQKTEATATLTINGEARETATVVDIAISVLFRPITVTVLQMDAAGAVLHRAEYKAGQLPETIAAEQQTAYLVVETAKANSEGETSLTRELFDKGDESLTAYYAREDGFCIPQTAALIWPGQEGGNP